MLGTKRCGGDLTRSKNEELTTSKDGGETIGSGSNKSQKKCTGGGEMIESFPSGSRATRCVGFGSSASSDQDAWECIPTAEAVPKTGRSAVSVVLFDGDTSVFSCSGIPIQRTQSWMRVLTSANLARAMKHNRKVGSNMWIQVHDASNSVAPGWLQHYELDHGIAFVRVTYPERLNVCEVHLRNGVEFLPSSDLVAVQLGNGRAILEKGILTKDSDASEDSKVLCEISKSDDGGPLFDGDGNFVGMIVLLDTGRFTSVKRSVIIEQLEQFEKRKASRVRRTYGPFSPTFVRTDQRKLRQENYVLV